MIHEMMTSSKQNNQGNKMKYTIIATCSLTKSIRVVKTYAKLETAQKNLKLMIAKGSWFNETFSLAA